MKTVLRPLRGLALGLLALVCLSPSVLGQSTPGLVTGQVPTAVQWNSYFAAKQDFGTISPGGQSGQVQFNNSGAFGGSTNFSWNAATSVLTLNGLPFPGVRVSGSDVTFTSNTTLANITGLSVNLTAGRTYTFDVYLSFTCAAAGGIRAAIAGTATATLIEYDGWIVDSAANGIKGNAQAAALATTVANAAITGTAGVVRILGTITVANAGTLTVQAAQSATNGTATAIKQGSRMHIFDMP